MSETTGFLRKGNARVQKSKHEWMIADEGPLCPTRFYRRQRGKEGVFLGKRDDKKEQALSGHSEIHMVYCNCREGADKHGMDRSDPGSNLLY